MTNFAGLLDILKILGTSGIVFIIWMKYHDAVIAQLKTIIEQHFKLLSEMVSTMNLQTGLIQKMIEKIDTNQWCPVIKDVQHSGIHNYKTQEKAGKNEPY